MSRSQGLFRRQSADAEPRPLKPLDIWLGGSAPAAFRRIGRSATGGAELPHRRGSPRRPPADPPGGREAGREIEPDHFGINLAVSDGEHVGRAGCRGQARRPDSIRGPHRGDWPHLHRQLDAIWRPG